MYARGILFGKMKYELGDHSYIRCPETGMEADIEFKMKGWMGGTYNAIGGHISDKNGKHLFELSGLWNEEMWIKDLTVSLREIGSDYGYGSDVATDGKKAASLRRLPRKAFLSKGSTAGRAKRA